jgi:hypothetical protein
MRVGRTSFKLVGFSVVSNVWSFGFGDLHLTIFLGLSQSKILLVPLQAREEELVNGVSLSTIRA